VPARVIESALDVARAEVALLMVHVREVAVRAVGALLATILAAAFAQVAVVFLVVAPVLGQHMSTPRVVLAVALPATLALLFGWAARAAWRGIPRQASRESVPDEAWTDTRPVN